MHLVRNVVLMQDFCIPVNRGENISKKDKRITCLYERNRDCILGMGIWKIAIKLAMANT